VAIVFNNERMVMIDTWLFKQRCQYFAVQNCYFALFGWYNNNTIIFDISAKITYKGKIHFKM